jgi:hypothetical protein
MAIITRTLKVVVKVEVPDDDEDLQESVNAVLEDCDYNFSASDHHKQEGCDIVETEIIDFGEED